MATDKVTAANKRIAAAASADTAAKRLASGPVGAKMIEMLEVPSFARGLKPSMLFDLAKDKGVISKEQQADFTKRVGKDRTALAEFNKIVTEAGKPRLAYRGQSPVQIEMIRARNLLPATAANQPERIRTLKTTSTLVKEAAEMDATPDVKQKKFLSNMRKAFGDFVDTPIVKKITQNALKILAFIPSGPLDALEFMPPDLIMQLQEGMNMGDMKPEPAAEGGMMNIKDMIRPVGFANGGVIEDASDLSTSSKRLLLKKSLIDDKGSDSLKKMYDLDRMSPVQIEIEFQKLMGVEE